MIKVFSELIFTELLEQPCFESSINFAARVFDREATVF